MPKIKVKCKPPEWNDKDKLAYSWCLKHGIKITPSANSQGFYNKAWNIDVDVNGNKVQSPKAYGVNDLWPKVFELYKFYYNKYKEK